MGWGGIGGGWGGGGGGGQAGKRGAGSNSQVLTSFSHHHKTLFGNHKEQNSEEIYNHIDN